ncbi:MAG TPA: 3-oxoacyl-ACP reductase family protein [Vicinamibacterales bacterium]|jgi:3-oxoacyl-[acyl-carrier protein] reductase|nr:3-oxoacyl-ACP reductase family protein [Vicinamibacterales bacterium]
MSEIQNRVALVTGGSRGIGTAVALALSRAGAAVAVNYHRHGDDAEAVAESIRTNGGRAATFGADVSLSNAVKSMVHDVEERLGPIDILVNNAGIAITRGLADLTEDDFDRTIAGNLKSAFLCTQAVLEGMRARRWGRIVNISSIGARLGAGSVSVAYGASKAGLEGLTRAYALRLAAEGITVNAVAPGLVDTEMGKPLIEAGVTARVPVGRAGTPDEIAQAVVSVVANAYMTGQTIAVNGGSLFS